MNDLQIVETAYDAEECQTFLSAHYDELGEIFPDFSVDDAVFCSVDLLKIKEEIIGVLVYLGKGEELHIEMDYLIPSYRDQGIGKKMFAQKIQDFKAKGYRSIMALTDNQNHKDYLISNGFKTSSKNPLQYEMELS